MIPPFNATQSKLQILSLTKIKLNKTEYGSFHYYLPVLCEFCTVPKAI